MKRIALFAALALALTVALAACQKKQTETSSLPEEQGTQGTTDQVAQAPEGGQATTPEPAMTEAPTPAPATTAKPRSSTTAKSPATTRTSRTTHAVPAEAQKTMAVPIGTQFDVSTITPMDTRTSQVGDKIEGRLAAPITQDGMTIAEEGAILRGEITQVQAASKSRADEDKASLSFVFTSIETIGGEKPLHATVTNAEGKLVAGGTGKRDALIIGGSTVAGAVLGKVLGKDTKGAVLGAVGGAVVGTGIVLSAKGHELEVPAGSRVQMRVDQPITVVSK